MAHEEVIYDIITKETSVRAYTAAEIAETEKVALQVEAEKAEAAIKLAAKAALLERLGITADEAALLFS